MTKKRKVITSILIVVAVIIVGAVGFTINTNYQYSQKVKQGDLLLASGKYDKADTVYEQALKIKKTDEVQAKIDKSLLLYKSSNDFDTAMKDFNVKDYSTAVSFFKAVLKDDTKNYAIAVEKIKQGIKLEDDSAIAQAKISASKGDYDTAIQTINSALSTDANNKQMLDLNTKYTASNNAKIDADAKAKAIEDARIQAKADADAKAKASTEGVRIGMTTQQCIDSSWGRPDSINRTTTASGVSEQWVYGDTSYLYFDSGILTDIQN